MLGVLYGSTLAEEEGIADFMTCSCLYTFDVSVGSVGLVRGIYITQKPILNGLKLF